MEDNKTRICRLCFVICKSGFEVIENTSKDILFFLLPNLNLGISHEPVVCSSCVGNLKKWSDFKGYLHREDHPSVKREDIILNEPQKCLDEDIHVDASTAFGGSNVCCFCMALINQESSVVLQKEENNVRAMLEKYFPEPVFNLTVDSSACTACYQSLQDHLAFTNSCLAIEEKIKEYCRVEGTNSKGQVELNSVLHFVSKSQLQSYCDLEVVKVEECQKQMDNDIKIKVENESIAATEEKQFNIKEEDVSIKTETNGSTRFDASYAKYKDSKLPGHTVADSSFPEEAMHACEVCSFQTKYKGSLQRHKLTHKSPSEVTVYKCDICHFQTKHKKSSQLHTLTHKHISEVPRYGCEMCGFQTKYKSTIQKHILTHKSPSEVPVYECKLCTFQSKFRNYLDRHMLSHKSASEVTMYTCEMCGYQTKRAGNLQAHILTHKGASEVTAYKCELCPFQTKHSTSLQRHKLTHKSPSEVTMYKCERCPFQTKHKRNLQLHEVTHKDISEVVGYKCEMCEFRTKQKRNLQLHVLTHKSTSEVTMHLCDICGFQTKHKRNLRIHMLIHKNASEITMYSCEECAFETKYKGHLSKHMLTHRSPTVYKCDICEFQCSNSRSYSNHMRSHKHLVEVATVSSSLHQSE